MVLRHGPGAPRHPATRPERHPMREPFDFKAWTDANAHLLKPPAGDRLIFEDAQIVGGPNQRVDFHDDPKGAFEWHLFRCGGKTPPAGWVSL
jgi:hypothetical protein